MNNFQEEQGSIGITMPAILGSLVGAFVGNKSAQNKINKRDRKELTNATLGGDYYSQVDHILKNLNVAFTPISVIYLVNNGGRQVTIETISTSEMNAPMRTAWQMKDESYFKNLLVNKMRAEVMLAEKIFAGTIIDNHLNSSNAKTASAKNYTCIEREHYIEKIAEVYEAFPEEMRGAVAQGFMGELPHEEIEKLSFIFDKPMGDEYREMATAPLDYPMNKGDKSAFEIQKKLMDKDYLSKKLKVSFFPDRVIFSVDDRMIDSLLVIDMNPEGYEAFRVKNRNFFKRFLLEEIDEGIENMVAAGMLKKKASYEFSAVPGIFVTSSAHPAIYMDVLNGKYGDEWIDMEPEVIVMLIERDFGLVEGMSDVALNIILTIKTLNISDTMYTVPHAFEKAIRSLNGLTIDWEISERDGLQLSDIVFGIDAINMCTPKVDIYEHFSQGITGYIGEVVAEREIKTVLSDYDEVEDAAHNIFYEALNKDVLNRAITNDIGGETGLSERAEIIALNEFIFGAVKSLADELQAGWNVYTDEDVLNLVESNFPDAEDNVRAVIYNNALESIRAVSVMRYKRRLYSLQRRLYGLE